MEFFFNPETGRVEQRQVDNSGIGISSMYDQVYGPFNVNRRDSEIIVGADEKAKTIPIIPMTSDEIIASNIVPPDFNTDRFQSIFPTSGIMSQTQFVEDDDLEASAIPKFGEGELKQSRGIGDLFRAALGFIIPGANLFMGDRSMLQGIKSLNQRLRNTDFGQSKTLQEYFQRREARKDNERLKTVNQQLQEAADRSGGYQPTTQKQNVSRTSSRVSGGKTKAYGL